MSSTLTRKITPPSALDAALLSRILREGYGEGAWHGPDLKAALGDVTPELAFWRPGAGRHNIAEIALHHAFFARSVRAQIRGEDAEPFVLEGEDWFELPSKAALNWPRVLEVVATQQKALEKTIGDVGTGRVTPPKDVKVLDLVLGITCHAVYHAGQVQLIKRLRSK
jgi:DinB family protein